MSYTTPTKAHLALISVIREGSEPTGNDHLSDGVAAQIIAESEFAAVINAVANLTCTNHNDRQRAECPVCLVVKLREENRVFREVQKVCADCDSPTNAEVSALRAEVARLTNQRDNLLKPMRDQAMARAEHAEAEVARLSGLRTQAEAAMTDVAEARAENAEIIAEHYRLVTLRQDAELAEARKDSARLDWVQENDCEESCNMTMPRYTYQVKQWEGAPGPSIRAAIDAAREQKGVT